jgi:hypothetical protein
MIIYCKYEDCESNTFQMWTDGYIQCTNCGMSVDVEGEEE